MSDEKYDIFSIKDINNIRYPPIDMKIDTESHLDDNGKYTIDRGVGVG
jgi:hypothetical protein